MRIFIKNKAETLSRQNIFGGNCKGVNCFLIAFAKRLTLTFTILTNQSANLLLKAFQLFALNLIIKGLKQYLVFGLQLLIM